MCYAVTMHCAGNIPNFSPSLRGWMAGYWIMLGQWPLGSILIFYPDLKLLYIIQFVSSCWTLFSLLQLFHSFQQGSKWRFIWVWKWCEVIQVQERWKRGGFTFGWEQFWHPRLCKKLWRNTARDISSPPWLANLTSSFSAHVSSFTCRLVGGTTDNFLHCINLCPNLDLNLTKWTQ